VIAFDVGNGSEWREVDLQLRAIAKKRAALDGEEARWLREADRLQIWRHLGMVSALDYMERVLGYAPHNAMERLRTARALGALPIIEAALDRGELCFSAVRELSRVATPSTDDAWRRAACGKNLRQIEELVAGRQVGDHPDDPKRPDQRTWTIKLKVQGDAYARWRQAQKVLSDEHGVRLDDSELAGAFADAVLEAHANRGGGGGGGGGDAGRRARYQIMMTVCSQCRQGWQHGAGKQLAVDAATVERACCDAIYIGSTEDDVPVRASQDIPPRVRRFVWHRDGGRCTAPGCRSSRCVDIHHKRPRELGGGHEPANLCLLCSACHAAVHRGTLILDDDGGARRPNAPVANTPVANAVANTPVANTNVAATNVEMHPNIDLPARIDVPARIDAPVRIDMPSTDTPSTLDRTIHIAQARDALVGLGWKTSIARIAVERAMSHVGRDAPLEAIIREALRRCPRPTG
jgi:hypothetical protein